MKETSVGCKADDKELNDVKTLIGVKDCMESVFSKNDSTVLSLDQLDEALKFLQSNGISKDKEMKQTKKLFDDFNSLKKTAKDTKKKIQPMVEKESKTNASNITKHEDELKTYIVSLKKKDIYKYDTGRDQALSSLKLVDEEIKEKIAQTEVLRYNAEKFE